MIRQYRWTQNAPPRLLGSTIIVELSKEAGLAVTVVNVIDGLELTQEEEQAIAQLTNSIACQLGFIGESDSMYRFILPL